MINFVVWNSFNTKAHFIIEQKESQHTSILVIIQHACLKFFWKVLAGKYCFIDHILLTFLHLIFPGFGDYKVIWSLLGCQQERRLKITCIHISLQKLRNFTGVAFRSLLTDGMILWKATEIMLRNKYFHNQGLFFSFFYIDLEIWHFFCTKLILTL